MVSCSNDRLVNVKDVNGRVVGPFCRVVKMVEWSKWSSSQIVGLLNSQAVKWSSDHMPL